MNDLRELYINELGVVLDAERQLVKALPKLAKAASSEDLQAAFQTHLQQTKDHVERLESILEELGEDPKNECTGMKGIIGEGQKALEGSEKSEVQDAALINAAQRAEHYEIGSYGTLRAWANTLGEADAAALLEKTLDEESETDAILSSLAASINADALAEVAEED